MSGFTPLTLAQLVAIEATAFASQPGVVPANTDPGSTAGAIFNSPALMVLFAENELEYVEDILRMATIPALESGAPNPDLGSFTAPWNITWLGASAATGTVTCSTPSPVSSQIVVPAGAIISTSSGTTGIQFQIEPGGAGYSATLGGYPITAGNSSVNVPVSCLTTGIVGNVAAETAFTPIGGTSPMPPAVNSITNATAFDDAENIESDQALKARFTTQVSTGVVGTPNAIVAALLKLQPGVIVSYGNAVNADLSAHAAFFTVFVNVANSGTTAPAALVTEANALLNDQLASGAVVSGGIEFACTGPAVIPVNAAATLVLMPGIDPTLALAAAEAQHAAFLNGIGMSPNTVPTVCSPMRYGAAMFQTQVNGQTAFFDILGLTLNSSTTDLTAAFGNQFVAGTPSFTIS